MNRILTALLLIAPAAHALDTQITGTVQSKCQIATDTAGVYGNPNGYTLTTSPNDGGVTPVVRFDVSQADAFYARIHHPTSFSDSPSLNDTPVFTGSTTVGAVGDAGMSGYEAAKTTFANTTQYDLTVAGSTWFKTTSVIVNGGQKAFPGGTYRAVVEAECIAK